MTGKRVAQITRAFQVHLTLPEPAAVELFAKSEKVGGVSAAIRQAVLKWLRAGKKEERNTPKPEDY